MRFQHKVEIHQSEMCGESLDFLERFDLLIQNIAYLDFSSKSVT